MISRRTWFLFILGSVLSICIWYVFSYPKFAFLDISVDRAEALVHARKFLKAERGIDPNSFRQAIIFVGAKEVDRYLQRSIGFRGERDFFKKHQYEIFFWKVRFYREGEKEEYNLTVSAMTGQVTNFSHALKETAAYPDLGEESSKQKVVQFLERHFKVAMDDYEPEASRAQKLTNRTNYEFSWKKKGVYVKWSPDPDAGGAFLSMGAAITGDDIISFSKAGLRIPDDFNRYIARQKTVGENLSILFNILFFALLTAAVFFVISRRGDLVMHTMKHFSLGVVLVVMSLGILNYCNGLESVLYRYPTTTPFSSYIWQSLTSALFNIAVGTICIMMPLLAGESLYYESFSKQPRGGFLHYVRSTFFSRDLFRLCLLGYLVAIIMIGLQALAFELGQRYLGVSVEYTWMVQVMGSYLPFLAAFSFGFSVSLTEEISFRLFSISLGKKFLRRTGVAVVAAAIIWGYGHSHYLVFPMWFRGLEVACLGIFLGAIYLRYGIVTVVVAHYLFDVFWGMTAHLLGKSSLTNFYSSFLVLLMPLLFGIIAYIKNQEENERSLSWRLTSHQIFNLGVLKEYLRLHPPPADKSLSVFRREIVQHGWDIAVVEKAFQEIYPGRK